MPATALHGWICHLIIPCKESVGAGEVLLSNTFCLFLTTSNCGNTGCQSTREIKRPCCYCLGSRILMADSHGQ
jgi:hypothetical protein